MLNLVYFINHWKPLLEILVLWGIIYQIMLFFAGTRAIQVLRGLVVLVIAFLLVQVLGFEVLEWLLTKLFAISVIALLLIFSPEIREGLAHLGRRHLFSATSKEQGVDFVLGQVAKAAETLSKSKIGALIAIENKDTLNGYVESGVKIDAQVSSEIVQTIFTPNSLLHDGGLIIQRGRVIAAGCLFPLSQKQELSRIYGTRHRAALGLSEETDALIIVVSEERQDISLTFRGKLHRDLSAEDLIAKAKQIIELKEKPHA